MINLTVIHTADPDSRMFRAFKEYASIADDCQDLMLRALLRTAMQEVGAWEDKSLLVQTLRQTVTEREDNSPVHLYRNPSEVLSVKDGKGNAVAYTLTPEGVNAQGDTLVITYTTEVNEGDVQMLTPKVLRYATALYDGELTTELNKILLGR